MNGKGTLRGFCCDCIGPERLTLWWFWLLLLFHSLKKLGTKLGDLPAADAIDGAECLERSWGLAGHPFEEPVGTDDAGLEIEPAHQEHTQRLEALESRLE